MNSFVNENVFIDDNCVIEENVKIYPGVFILGNSEIKSGTIIYPNSFIFNSKIGKNCEIKNSYIEESEIKDNVVIGPFAHIRPNSFINNFCKIGNFVEIKSSYLGERTKASHLAYIGDCEVGKNCNIGCGVIVANYNGKTKNKTKIGDNCFIGSNSNLIAPLTISDNCYICAGTTLTKNTQEGDFVIGRTREIIKSNRAYKYLKV